MLDAVDDVGETVDAVRNLEGHTGTATGIEGILPVLVAVAFAQKALVRRRSWMITWGLV